MLIQSLTYMDHSLMSLGDVGLHSMRDMFVTLGSFSQ